ncbi:MAG: glycosyltransferase family 39 protein [bacterium]|nr:glycosyltransferase family 39 protein [bacterium]
MLKNIKNKPSTIFVSKMVLGKPILLLVIILFLAIFLRFYNVTIHDPYTDEVLLGFRAIKMIDYDLSLVQTTPWQWVDSVPGWMRLSFHDHPILFFLMQHISIRTFGENMLALRLPSILTGIASVYMIYLLASRLINKRAGYIAGSLLAVGSYHVWVSRLGIQDGAVIFFTLLILWLWIKALEEDKKYLWILWGAALGLGIITKLTILIIIPILFVYALIYKHKIITNKFFWYGILASVIFSAPLWLYNLALYKNFGHFDFQISALLNQYVEKWQFRQGREMVGGIGARFRYFFETMKQANNYVFNYLLIGAFVSALCFSVKKKSKLAIFLLLALVLEVLWFFVIGSTLRFVVMVIPYCILLISYLFAKLFEFNKYKKVIYVFLILVFSVELLFTINTFFVSPSWGWKNLTYAQIQVEEMNFGWREVNDYLDDYLDGKTSSAYGKPIYQFMVDLQNQEIEKEEKLNFEKYPLVIIYDKDFNFLSRLWTFQRRLIYKGWPVMSDVAFYNIIGDIWEQYYKEQGVEHFLYFTGVEEIDFGVGALYWPYPFKTESTEFEKYLLEKGVKPEFIKNKAGKDTFKVYKF